jgi:hypothetical protein
MTMALPFANYEEERRLFSALLGDSCAQRILLVKGKSGMGKSSLLRSCLGDATARDDVLLCPIDLRGSATNVAEIFSHVSRRVGREALPGFQNAVQVHIEGNKMLGTNQQIQVALQVSDPASRGERLAAMTDALFSDLVALPRPFVLAMDTYEQAVDEVRDWVAGPLLRRVADTPSVRALVAGQVVPETAIDWHSCCHSCELYGVREAREWLPVVEAMGRQVPVEPALTWLAGLCHAFDGRPNDIAKMIEGLPRKEAS